MTVAELLDSPEKWTKRAFAKDADGRHVNEQSDRAVCWCLAGAVWRCYGCGPEADEAFEKLWKHVALHGAVSKFNDHYTTIFEDIRRVVLAAGV